MPPPLGSKQFKSVSIQSVLRHSNSLPIYTIPHRFCSKPFSSSATLFYALPFLFQSTLFPFGSHLFVSISSPVASIPLPIPALRFLAKANRGISTLSHVVSIHFTAPGFVALGFDSKSHQIISQLIFSNAPLYNSFSFLGLSNPYQYLSMRFPIITARSYSSSSLRFASPYLF